MTKDSGLRTPAKESVVPVLASESASLLPEVQHYRGTTGSLQLHERKRESERAKMSQKDFGCRNAGAMERTARAD